MYSEYRVYANRTQANKVVTILNFVQVFVKVVTHSIKIHYEKS